MTTDNPRKRYDRPRRHKHLNPPRVSVRGNFFDRRETHPLHSRARTRRGYRGRRIAFDTEEPEWSSKTCRQESGGYLPDENRDSFGYLFSALFSPPPTSRRFRAIILLGENTWTRTRPRLAASIFSKRKQARRAADNGPLQTQKSGK